MYKYSKLNINILSFIIVAILFNIFSFTNENIENTMKKHEEINSKNNKIEELKEKKIETIENKEEKKNEEETKYPWEIKIPKIQLSAPISEGTTKEVMDKYVGHFVDTGVIKGNICLGAHNRGYPVNYFENIKNLVKGDYIYYKKDDVVKNFKVEIVTVIKDTDWTYLENTEDNRLTLITCVENEPDYRRCIQAIEYKEEK